MSNEKAIIGQLDIAEKAMLRDVLSFMVFNSLSLKERHLVMQEIMTITTSAGIIFNQEFIQSSPASSDSDHQCTTQDSNHPQLLGISKLEQTLNNIILQCYKY